ncbi:hypothetical protein QBC35DRAFT_463476 [Podospora australis]|uniref:CFEM domain-containing protein n=1 Tax=Podospora australis TaxID=1536484 RepID=A0AAN6WTF3_9PEZI|nr:hypothetical protein QBC35DRAFT_463476 [Podospora australis]
MRDFTMATQTFRLFLVLCFISTVPIFSLAALSGGISINGEPGYQSLRACAQGCFCCNNARPELGIEGLGCYPGWLNKCFCRTDQLAIATKFLSKCIYERCVQGDAGPDYHEATSVYVSYCVAAGYTPVVVVNVTPTIEPTVEPAVTTSTTTQETGSAAVTVSVTKITVVTQTVSSDSPATRELPLLSPVALAILAGLYLTGAFDL